MLGFVAYTRFDESKIWKYASIGIFEETGGGVKIHKGKIFRDKLIDNARKLKVGQQVFFKTRDDSRGNRKYMQFTEIKPTSFVSCTLCGQPQVNGSCLSCSTLNSERLDGEFTIVEVSDQQYAGSKLVLRRNDMQFAFIQWDNGPFGGEQFAAGDVVKVLGWRTETRLTQLRELYKVEKNSMLKDDEPVPCPSTA